MYDGRFDGSRIAGDAAALAVRDGLSPEKIKIRELQNLLINQKIKLPVDIG